MTAGLAARFEEVRETALPSREVDWYAGHVPSGSGPVLDGACGTGRLLAALAARHVNVHGVVQDAEVLAACERRLAACALHAPLFRQELPSLNLPFRYGMAFVACARFQDLADHVMAGLALARLRAHLVDPGILLLDLVVPALAAHPPGALLVEIERVTLPDRATITLRSETAVDVERRRIARRERYERREGTRITDREDRRIVRTWYAEDDARALLLDAGFREVRIESPPGSDAVPDEHRFAVVAIV